MLMKKIVRMGTLAAAVAVTSPASESFACNPNRPEARCGGGCHRQPAAPATPVRTFPQPMPQPMPSPGGVAGGGMGGNGIGPNDVIDVDIPAEAKQAIRAAAKAAQGYYRSGVGAAELPSEVSKRIQLTAAQQMLAGQTAQLETALAAIARWNGADQQQFQAAFGASDEATRFWVARALWQQIVRNRQAQAALAQPSLVVE